MDELIRQVLRDHARITRDVDQLSDDSNLYQAGMTSHASVSVMLALEDAFDVEFPESMLKKATFESITSIRSALNELASSAIA